MVAVATPLLKDSKAMYQCSQLSLVLQQWKLGLEVSRLLLYLSMSSAYHAFFLFVRVKKRVPPVVQTSLFNIQVVTICSRFGFDRRMSPFILGVVLPWQINTYVMLPALGLSATHLCI